MEFQNYNRGNVFVPCKWDNITDPLLSESQVFTATASTQSTDDYTIKTGRGDVWGIQLFIGSTTIADLAAATLTLNVNGTSCLENEMLLKFSSLYQNDRVAMIIHIPEKATMQAIVNNGSASAIPISISYLYYNPYNQNNISTRI